MIPLLQAFDIVVNAGTKSILDHVSFALEAGECMAVVGPNGAGKSTLLRVLSGELKPRSGRVRIADRDLASLGPRALAHHRAVLSQSITVSFPFTVAEVVAMGAGERHGARVDRMVADALAEVDLAGFSERVFPTLSGGEQQRAHFARILVQLACGEAAYGPGLLLLDEPTASLDLKHQLALAASAKRCAARGTAVLAILHDLNLAALFADRVLVLDRGRVACEGAPAAVVNEEILAAVFGVRSAVGKVPAAGLPFVLPHAAEPAT
jgi:iron complex transport system ATP-binding protein